MSKIPLEDFDWDAFERSETQSMQGEDASVASVTDIIEGTIIAITKREVVVNIGFNSDGIIPMSEFRYNPDLEVGDTVEVYMENLKDKKGQLILSHTKARLSKSWERVNAALDNEEIIQGYIKCRTKGGMIVDVFGIDAFLPGSQIDVHPIRDYDIFVGKTMEFKIIEINNEYKNVVISRKAIIETKIAQERTALIASFSLGQIVEGVVANITDFGVFLDLGGVNGLIHITNLSWTRVNHPSLVCKLDQKVTAKVLDVNPETGKIELGLKQLSKKLQELTEGDIILCTIESKVQGGYLVSCYGYKAFLPYKECIQYQFSEDDTIPCIVLSKTKDDKERLRITLSQKVLHDKFSETHEISE